MKTRQNYSLKKLLVSWTGAAVGTPRINTMRAEKSNWPELIGQKAFRRKFNNLKCYEEGSWPLTTFRHIITIPCNKKTTTHRSLYGGLLWTSVHSMTLWLSEKHWFPLSVIHLPPPHQKKSLWNSFPISGGFFHCSLLEKLGRGTVTSLSPLLSLSLCFVLNLFVEVQLAYRKNK